MKCSLGISDFLEEIFSLSHSVVFLYFFTLISEKGFLISSCYSGMGEFNSNDHYIYYCGQESQGRNGVAIMVKKESKKQYLDATSKTTE